MPFEKRAGYPCKMLVARKIQGIRREIALQMMSIHLSIPWTVSVCWRIGTRPYRALETRAGQDPQSLETESELIKSEFQSRQLDRLRSSANSDVRLIDVCYFYIGRRIAAI